MRTRNKIFGDCDLYFITCTIEKWIPIFESDLFCDVIIKSFKYCRKHKKLLLHHYVIMPDHLHAIISSNPKNISNIIRDFKRHTSIQITSLLQKKNETQLLSVFKHTVKDHEKDTNHSVWQDGYHPIAITTDFMLDEIIEYIHLNPVIKGYVDEPEAWRYSSARNIYLGVNSIIELDNIRP